MDYVIAKLRSKQGTEASKYKKILSNIRIYTLPDDLNSHVPYNASTNLDDNEWFTIDHFSEKNFCLGFLKSDLESIAFSQMEATHIDKIDFICTYQGANEYYFQKIAKVQLLAHKLITLGDVFNYTSSSKNIAIRDIPDAIYLKSTDTLYFKKLSSITSIFKGIDQLFREATEAETQRFLEKDFITLGASFKSNSVKKANRKRIALALQALDDFDDTQKGVIFHSLQEYCPQLTAENQTFRIETDDDLKLLLFGIDQRFYTTPDGREKRIANSIIRL
jgi:hypothetical protein